MVEVKYKQHLDPLLMYLMELVLNNLNKTFFEEGDGVLMCHGRLCVPDVDDLTRKNI